MQETRYEAMPEAIYRSLGDADAIEFSTIVARLPYHDWSIAHFWSAGNNIAVTAVLREGRFQTWQIYPCDSEEEARIMGDRSAALARSAIAAHKRSEAAADAAMQRARRLN